MLERLPNELLYMICSNLMILYYIRLRKSCKRFYQLEYIPTLYLEAFKESSEAYKLIDRRFKLNMDDVHKDSINYLIKENHHRELLRILQIKPQSFNKEQRSEILITMARCGNCEGVKYLLDTEIDFFTDRSCDNALDNAICMYHYDVVELLIKKHIEINRYHFHLALYSNYTDVVKLLVKKDASTIETSSLSRAIHYNNFELAKFLLENGANNYNDKYLAFIEACYDNNIEMAKFLLPYGVVNNNQQLSVLYNIAANRNYLEFLKFLIEIGIKPTTSAWNRIQRHRWIYTPEIYSLLRNSITNRTFYNRKCKKHINYKDKINNSHKLRCR